MKEKDGGDSSAGSHKCDIMALTPLKLALKNGSKEVVRSLVVAATDSSAELKALLEDLGSYLDSEEAMSLEHQEILKDMFTLLFNYDELSHAAQELTRVPQPIKALSDSSYLVTVPCNMFTFGCPAHGRSRGRFYYEVVFGEECPCFEETTSTRAPTDSKQNIDNFASLMIGWATDNFAEVSKDHVGSYPISWSFCPWDHWEHGKTGRIEKKPVVRLNGQKKRMIAKNAGKCLPLSGPDCGVGVCVDLNSCQIAWRLFWPKDATGPRGVKVEDTADFTGTKGDYKYTWVYAPTKDGANVGTEEKKAWNPMGREWTGNGHQVFPCISVAANGTFPDLCTVHLSGEFCMDPPNGFLPAVSEAVNQGSAAEQLPLLPLKNAFGNTDAQVKGRWESLSLLHVCAIQGTPGVEIATKLVTKFDVPYMPMLDVKANDFDHALLLKSVHQDDLYSTPYRVAMRAGGSSVEGIDGLADVHMEHILKGKQHRRKVLNMEEVDEDAGQEVLEAKHQHYVEDHAMPHQAEAKAEAEAFKPSESLEYPQEEAQSSVDNLSGKDLEAKAKIIVIQVEAKEAEAKAEHPEEEAQKFVDNLSEGSL